MPLRALVLVLTLGLWVPAALFGSSVILPGKANIFGAGHSSLPAVSGGSGVLPTEVDFTPQPYLVLHFPTMTGQIGFNQASYSLTGPNGFTTNPGDGTDINSSGSISGIRFDQRAMFIVGVFLTDAVPSGAAPPSVNYTGADGVMDFHPQVGQTFFIGDGLTTSGQQQHFWVPATATRLFLGFADGMLWHGTPSNYGDNQGQYTITADFTPMGPTGAPEPGSFALAGLAIVGLVWKVRKRA